MYALAVLFSPSGGVIAQARFQDRTAQRIVREDLLAMLYRVEEVEPTRRLAPHDALEALGGGWRARRALWKVVRRGHVERDPSGLLLTPRGKELASQLVRTHRLWETYLVEELGLALDHVHEPAHRVEHFLDEHLSQQIADQLPQSSEDPHGREIPG
jgi:Mn-dependent DtxR family transcriptional regulator